MGCEDVTVFGSKCGLGRQSPKEKEDKHYLDDVAGGEIPRYIIERTLTGKDRKYNESMDTRHMYKGEGNTKRS